MDSDRFEPIVEWSEREVILPPNTPQPGRLHLTKAQKGILKAYQDDEINQLTMMASSQIGKSLVMLLILGYHVGCRPMSILLVQPRIRVLGRFVAEKLQPLIDSTPVINDSIQRTRVGTLRPEMIPYRGGTIFTAYSGSPATLRSVSAQLVLGDEVDLYAGTVDASNPIEMLRQRGEAFGKSAKLVLASTPVDLEESLIYNEYKKGSASIFQVPCPKCSLWHEIEWSNVRDGALYCPGCTVEITEKQRMEILNIGEWVSTNEEAAAGHASFHISQLYSPFKTLAETASRYDPTNTRGFTTQVLGLPFSPAVFEPITMDDMAALFVSERVEKLEELSAITAGVDVQGNRLEVQIVEWIGMTPHVRAHKIIQIAPVEDVAWIDLSQLLEEHNPDMVFIDRGYRTTEVRQFVASYLRDFLLTDRLRLIRGINRSSFKDDLVIRNTKDGRSIERYHDAWIAADRS